MRKDCNIALVGGLAVAVGAAACWKWMIRMPLREFTRHALYMAVLDDEICRNELEGNQIGDQVITFATRAETLQERYHLFLELNRAKDRRQLQQEISYMEQRLRESRQYADRPGERLEVEFSEQDAR